MRIQEANHILNEARIQRLDAERHSGGNMGGFWTKMKSSVSNVFARKDVQVGLVTAGTAILTAGVGLLSSSRSRKQYLGMKR